MPFHLLIDLLRRAFSIDEGDPEAAVVEKVERAIVTLGEDLQWTLPLVRYLLSVEPGDPAVMDMDPDTRRIRIFDAVLQLAGRAAARRPLIIACEDVHWMDQATEAPLAMMADVSSFSRTHPPGRRCRSTRQCSSS